MRISRKILISTFAVLSAVSVPTTIAIAATSCSSSNQQVKTNLREDVFVNLIKQTTRTENFSDADVEEMVKLINEHEKNLEIVKALKSNWGTMFSNPGSDLSISTPTVVATADGEKVNVAINGIPDYYNKKIDYNVKLSGFNTIIAPTPAGYEINDWLPGDQFTKNGFTYEVIRNYKRYDWEGQPKYALKLVNADLETVDLAHMADDNSTGIVSSKDDVRGNIRLPLLIIGRHSVSKVIDGSSPDCVVGNGGEISIIIPDSVYNIEDSAFRDISNVVKDFHLSNKLEIIDGWVFTRLKYSGPLVLPDTLELIQNACFSGCWFTGELLIPPKIKEIPWGCFSWDTKFTSIKFAVGTQLKKIATNALYVMYPTENIYIPDTVKEIGDYCFGGVTYQAKKITISLPKAVNIDISKNHPESFNFIIRE